MAPTISTPTVADAPEVARIYVESWNEGFGNLLGRRTLSNTEVTRWAAELVGGRARWWVAREENDTVGFAGICASRDPVDPRLGELDTIAVDPRHCRSGVGRALMDVAVGAMREDGYASAILWTPTGHEDAHRFYEKMGWRRTGATRADGRHVAFERELADPGGARSAQARVPGLR